MQGRGLHVYPGYFSVECLETHILHWPISMWISRRSPKIHMSKINALIQYSLPLPLLKHSCSSHVFWSCSWNSIFLLFVCFNQIFNFTTSMWSALSMSLHYCFGCYLVQAISSFLGIGLLIELTHPAPTSLCPTSSTGPLVWHHKAQLSLWYCLSPSAHQGNGKDPIAYCSATKALCCIHDNVHSVCPPL